MRWPAEKEANRVARKKPPYDRGRPLEDPSRRQFALRVLRARERKRLAELQADVNHAAAAKAAIARIRAVLDMPESDDAP